MGAAYPATSTALLSSSSNPKAYFIFFSNYIHRFFFLVPSQALNLPLFSLQTTQFWPSCASTSTEATTSMAGAWSSVAHHVIGSTTIELSGTPRTGPPVWVRLSTRNNFNKGIKVSTFDEAREAKPEGPSCIFVGPVDSASKETLEALYNQARLAYDSGTPLIVDAMFDRVELKLRWYGSKYVVKYPRCSLRRQSTYADAEEDPSQVFALASVWLMILGFGCSVCLMPIVCTIVQAYQDAFSSGNLYASQASKLKLLAMVSGIMYMLLGSIVGYPIASASVGALQGLWKNNLVALKGACPNCGEEVFAFVRSDQCNQSPHKADCHVCESSLEFRTKVEQSISKEGKQWVYGRIYLIRKRGRRKRWA